MAHPKAHHLPSPQRGRSLHSDPCREGQRALLRPAALNSPVTHEPAPALEQVRPPVGRLDLDLAADLVRQRGFHHLLRMIRLLGRPIPKARPEGVRHRRDSQLSMGIENCRVLGTESVRDRLPASPPGPPGRDGTAGPGVRGSPSCAGPGWFAPTEWRPLNEPAIPGSPQSAGPAVPERVIGAGGVPGYSGMPEAWKRQPTRQSSRIRGEGHGRTQRRPRCGRGYARPGGGGNGGLVRGGNDRRFPPPGVKAV